MSLGERNRNGKKNYLPKSEGSFSQSYVSGAQGLLHLSPGFKTYVAFSGQVGSEMRIFFCLFDLKLLNGTSGFNQFFTVLRKVINPKLDVLQH